MSRREPPVVHGAVSNFTGRRRLVISGAFVLVAAITGWWWITAPNRWLRQAESLLPKQPAQADALAEEALMASVSASSRAWLVRCRAQLLLNHPLEAMGAFTQLAHPEQCDPVAWCSLIEEAQAANEGLLIDLAASAALRFREERARVLRLVLPLKVQTLPEKEVAELVEELRRVAGKDAQAWRALGVTEQSRGRLADALSAYRQAVSLSEVSQTFGLTARRELAQLLIDLGQFPEAEPLVAEVLKSTSANREDQLRLTQLRRAAGDKNGAKQLLDELLAREPESLPARLLRGTLLGDLDQLDAARADFEQCLHIAPFHAEAHYRLSQTLLRQGDPTSAAQHVREYRRLSELQRRLLEVNRRRAAAPQDPALLREIADLLEALGQPNTAGEWRRAAQALQKR